MRRRAVPLSLFEAAGYEVAHIGLNQWNGVAIASRVGIDDVERGFPGSRTFGDADPLSRRARSARPAAGCGCGACTCRTGGSLGRPALRVQAALAGPAARDGDGMDGPVHRGPDAQIALVGDWNVAPLDTDVWDVAAFEGHTHVTPPERAAFFAFADVGYTEVVPAVHPR